MLTTITYHDAVIAVPKMTACARSVCVRAVTTVCNRGVVNVRDRVLVTLCNRSLTSRMAVL